MGCRLCQVQRTPRAPGRTFYPRPGVILGLFRSGGNQCPGSLTFLDIFAPAVKNVAFYAKCDTDALPAALLVTKRSEKKSLFSP